MISYGLIRKERERCKKLLQAKLKEPIMRSGTLEEALELRDTIWTFDWILERNDND